MLAVTAPAARADFTFIHCSDIHVGAGEHAKTDAALFSEMSKLNPRPAFVVNTGDICEYGTVAQYEQYQDVLKSLGEDIKTYTAPGNHDVRWNPRGKEGYVKGTGQPLYQSWDWGNIHFILLDSTVLLEHWGHFSQEELNWLKNDLQKVGTEKPIIIGFHHWIGRDPVMVDNEQALLAVVKPYNVVLWLQGHGHSDIDWNIDGRPATMVGALYDGSYDIITVTDTELKISKRHLAPGQRKRVHDQGLAPESVPSETKPLMTIPLKKPAEPKWSADAKRQGPQVIITAVPPADAKMEYRLDADALKPLPPDGAKVAVAELSPGEHLVTVQATLPDKRAYQIDKLITLPGAVEPGWSLNIGSEVQSRLVRAADTLFVSTMGNDLVALDAGTGKQKWRFKTGGPIFSACKVDSGTVYFGSADHFVYALDAATGALKWKAQTDGAVLAGPNLACGIVCIGSTDTKIYGIDAATGSIIWTVPGQNMFQSQTATDGTRFFVGGWDNHFRCIDAKSGKVNWDLVLGRVQPQYPNFSAYAPAITSPAVGDGKVFISTNDGILHALNTEDGKEAWHIDWKNMGYSSPLYHDGRVYCALSDKGRVFCVDAKTGQFKWQTDTDSVIYDSSFCFGGGNVFIGNVGGVLNSIDANTGKIEWQYRLGPGHLLGSPVADDKLVYMGSMSGKVVALPVHASNAHATTTASSSSR
jgi:outer membrane protein assembly factor BamB